MSIQNKTVGLRELRENTEKYIREVKKGKSFTVFRHSKPIFNIVPADAWGDDGVWETVADFSKVKKDTKGVSAELLRKTLKSM